MATYKHNKADVEKWLSPNPLIKKGNGNGNGETEPPKATLKSASTYGGSEEFKKLTDVEIANLPKTPGIEGGKLTGATMTISPGKVTMKLSGGGQSLITKETPPIEETPEKKKIFRKRQYTGVSVPRTFGKTKYGLKKASPFLTSVFGEKKVRSKSAEDLFRKREKSKFWEKHNIAVTSLPKEDK